MVAQSTIDRVKAQLLALLPPGALFWRGATAKIVALVAAISVEFARVQEQLDALRAAVLPSEAEEFIFDWERTLGLPHTGTTSDRLAAISAKLLDRGGVSIPYFEALAAVFGYTISITEYLPARIGRMRCGDRMDGLGWGATWTVDAQSIDEATDQRLANTLRDARPAHTFVRPRLLKWSTPTSGTAQRLNGAVYGGGNWVLIGYGDFGSTAAPILTSNDGGVTWTSRTSGTVQQMVCIAFNGTMWVAGGSGGTLLTSTDLVTWTPRTSGTGLALLGACWSTALSLWIVVGANGVIITSPDGITWTTRTSGVSTFLRSVAVDDDGVVVACGDSGGLVTSTDGTSYTVQTSGTSSRLWSVAQRNRRWAIAGVGGILLTTNHITTWNVDDSGTTADLFAACWREDALVLAGANGLCRIRFNGTDWVPMTSGTANDLVGVANDGCAIVAVGLSGTIARAQQVDLSEYRNAILLPDGTPLSDASGRRLLYAA